MAMSPWKADTPAQSNLLTGKVSLKNKFVHAVNLTLHSLSNRTLQPQGIRMLPIQHSLEQFMHIWSFCDIYVSFVLLQCFFQLFVHKTFFLEASRSR
jgi:hypothetical protein